MKKIFQTTFSFIFIFSSDTKSAPQKSVVGPTKPI